MARHQNQPSKPTTPPAEADAPTMSMADALRQRQAEEAEEKAKVEAAADLDAQAKAQVEAEASVAKTKGEKPKTLLIHNTSAQLLHLTLPRGGEARFATTTALHETHTLMPGLNRVPVSVWERAKSQSMTRLRVENGDLVEIEDKPLVDVAERQALKLVNDTVERKLLHAWLADEKRPKVGKAIREQLEKIAPGPTRKADDE